MMKLLECQVETLAPLTARVGDLPVVNRPLATALAECLAGFDDGEWRMDFWPTAELLAELAALEPGRGWCIADPASGWLARCGDGAWPVAPRGVIIRYPWDVLAVNEQLVARRTGDEIAGVVRERVTIDGFLTLGEGSVLLPGVYIEGNVVIGRHSKIGPNCYLRGNTVIGDHCHVGQAVEVKNSVLMNRVGAGHLSYIGDSVVADDVNFGAGTITGNFRHDGKNHRSMVAQELVDTGRRKFGAIIGAGVHTGIHTAIYPGRKLGAGVQTLPGEVVRRDKW